MYRSITSVIAAALLAGGFGTAAQAQGRTVDFAFYPPEINVGEVCLAPEDLVPDPQNLGIEAEELSNSQRIRFLRRDITRLQAEDPDRWFNFIEALIEYRAQIDPAFRGIDETVAKIELYIDAGRTDELRRDGLVARLRDIYDASQTPTPRTVTVLVDGEEVEEAVSLSSTQRLILAQYFLNGIGVDQDVAFAQELIVDAAYQGNSNALLQVARFDLEGRPINNWDAPLDVTVSTAFGGLLGRVNRGICRRAERIAEEYLNGTVVSRNEDVAYAWYRFSADLGGGVGAWRMVEYHLNADSPEKDNAEMLRYLRLAVQRGITVDDASISQIASSGNVSEDEILGILGYNFSENDGRTRNAISRYFRLTVNIDDERIEGESAYMKYLRELTLLREAPGWIYTTLARETMIRLGRWAGEEQAMILLEEAALRGDAEGMQLLAKLLMRYRDNPASVDRAVGLLTTAVERHGLMEAMNDLDAIYRCKVNDAPRMIEASQWARAYRASEDAALTISATDLLVLDQTLKPRHLAKIQSDALAGRVLPTAQFSQLIQERARYTSSAHRLWAGRVDRSDQVLEAFVELEFELARNPSERDLAMELFRRIYLNNGVTTSLDLAIALVEHHARSPQIADEVIGLLRMAANRGKGAAIRFLARLQARDGRDPAEVFREFEQEIEERGDFLAIMFAIPYISQSKLDDYIDRAVSEMVCGTKDADEIGDAYAIWQDAQLSYHWRNIGLHFDYGHNLSKLRISDPQMDLWRAGLVPNERQIFERLLREGDSSAYRQLYILTSDPDLETYDPAAAAVYLAGLVSRNAPGDQQWILENFRSANRDLRAAFESQFDINSVFTQAIDTGSNEAKYEYGLFLRDNARSAADLTTSANILREAAEAGNVEAMTEYGFALAYGIGVPRDTREATVWLERAAVNGNERAASLISLVRIGVGQ